MAITLSELKTKTQVQSGVSNGSFTCVIPAKNQRIIIKHIHALLFSTANTDQLALDVPEEGGYINYLCASASGQVIQYMSDAEIVLPAGKPFRITFFVGGAAGKYMMCVNYQIATVH